MLCDGGWAPFSPPARHSPGAVGRCCAVADLRPHSQSGVARIAWQQDPRRSRCACPLSSSPKGARVCHQDLPWGAPPLKPDLQDACIQLRIGKRTHCNGHRAVVRHGPALGIPVSGRLSLLGRLFPRTSGLPVRPASVDRLWAPGRSVPTLGPARSKHASLP